MDRDCYKIWTEEFPLWLSGLSLSKSRHQVSDSHLKNHGGIPPVAWQLTNPTNIHEDAGLIPGLAQWVKDPALPCAVA